MTETTSIYQPNLLKGKVAFVTGGGTGICRGMTEALMRHGCNAVIISRTQSKLDEAARDLESKTGKQCLAVAGDVRKAEDMINAVEKALDRFKKIDIVVCGAAGNFLAPVEKLSYRAFKTVIDIDLIGTYNTIKACLEPLKQSKGCVINVTATLQYTGIPLQVHAASAKNGVDALTQVLCNELGEFGVRVNGIAPGPIDGTEGMTRLMPPNLSQDYIRTIPLRRLGSIRDIEMATLYLASPAAQYVSGHTMVVDGGAWMSQNAAMLKGLEMIRKKNATSKL